MLKNSRGMSLVEIIISLALLSVAGLILVKSDFISSKQEKKSKVTWGISDLQLAVGTEVKNTVLNSKDPSGKKTQGLCSVIEIDPNSTPPVGSVNLNMSKLSNAINETRVLSTIAELGFVVDRAGNCNASNFEFCFKLSNAGNYDQNLLSLDTKLKIKVEPVYLNPKNGKVFSKITGDDLKNKLDSKAVGFNFVTAISYLENGKTVTKTSESFEWSGLVGNCDYKLNGEDYIVSVTGMEHVENPNVIFNRAGFEGNKEDPVKVTFSKSIAQVGQQSVNGQYIFTATANNIETSCIEYNYKCPKQAANSRVYYAIGTKGKINHNYPNRLNMPLNSPVKIEYKIEKGNSNISSVTGKNLRLRTSTAVDCSSEFQTGNINGACSTSSPFPINKLPSSIDFSTSLEEGSGMASATCQEICKPETGYNSTSNGNDINNLWNGILEIILPNYNNEVLTFKAGERIVCTACYMKNCDQIGLGTFGKMEAQPYQPLDSNIPECVQYDDNQKKFNNFPLTAPEIKLDSVTADACVAARFSGDRLVYSVEECGKKYPVVCYGYGGFRIAMNYSSTNKVPATVTHDGAAERCYQMGREITNLGKLNSYLKKASTDIPQSGANYDFVNIVNQGMFLAPQEKQDIRNLKENIDKQSLAQSVSKFWIGVVPRGATGLGSSLESRIPTVVKDSDSHAVFFDGSGNLIHERYNEKLPATGNAAILYHDVKFKGVRYVAAENPMEDSTSLTFLCRENGLPWRFKTTSRASTKFSDGFDICKEEGMTFLPPATPNEWILAMLAVNPTHSKFPFPRGSNLKKAAWVAVEYVGGASPANWKIPNSSVADLNWLSTTHYSPTSSDPFILMNEKGEYVNPNVTYTLSTSDGIYKVGPYVDVKLIKDDKTIKLYENNSSSPKDMTAEKFLDNIKSVLDSNDIKYELDEEKINLKAFGVKLSLESNSKHTITGSGIPLKNVKELCVVDSFLSAACKEDSNRVVIRDLFSESAKTYWTLRHFGGGFYYKVKTL